MPCDNDDPRSLTLAHLHTRTHSAWMRCISFFHLSFMLLNIDFVGIGFGGVIPGLSIRMCERVKRIHGINKMVKHTFGSSAFCIRFRGRCWFLKLVARDKSILFLSSLFILRCFASLFRWNWNSFSRSVKSDRRFSLFSKIDYDIKRLTMETHFFSHLNEAGALERLAEGRWDEWLAKYTRIRSMAMADGLWISDCKMWFQTGAWQTAGLSWKAMQTT